MDWIDEHLLKEMKFSNELPELTETCLLLEKLLLATENNPERNYLLFSRAELDLLITTMNIDIGLLKEQYKFICGKYTTYDESNFYTMIKPSYTSNRNPNIPLLITVKQILFNSTNASAIKIIQNIDKQSFYIICKKIKHCMLVSSIEKKNLYYLDNDYGNKIIEDNFRGENCPLVDHWRKLYCRKLCIEQYYPKEPCPHLNVEDDLFFSESPYDDYLKREYSDLLPTLSLNDYYAFETKMSSIDIYHTDMSTLMPDSLYEYLFKFDLLLTPSHDIYKLSFEKLVWLNNHGTKYLTLNNPLFIHILFHLLFTSREDRDTIGFNKAKSSLNIPMESLDDYAFELEKIINFPSIPEYVINKRFYQCTNLYYDVHRLFFLNTPSWFKFLILNFDNSHLRAAKYLYCEFYIQRMHLRRTTENSVLAEIKQQLRLDDKIFATLYSICRDNPLIRT